MPKDTTNPVLKGCGFHHVALRARDFDRSLAFYTEGLGFRVAHRWGEGESRAVLLDLGDGNYLELFAAKPGQIPDEGAPGTGWPFLHLAFRSDDVEGAIERARALGAQVTVEPKTVPIGDPPIPFHIAFFLGPDGEVLELFDCEHL
uniref:VOC domain-containing protein n=1 Tax=uncultured Armatimonadetes bacterium TaxID=157466 RepID=A0A6J4H8V2_9BACT|nr:hypothetical protein AVDCRST_MAG63-163 [uncultured Armatimonadetes bacterium]